MDRPLEIRDVENISLEASDDNSGMYPQLVAQFTCQYEANHDCIMLYTYLNVCCSVVRMINVTHAAFEGINVIVTTPHVSGVILQQCSHLHIKSIIIYISIQEQDNDNNIPENECGILAYESSDIEMNSLEASNFTFGVALYMSRNTSMINVFAAHNADDGIYLYDSTDTSMTNVSAVQNAADGIFLRNSNGTNMMNVSAAHNAVDGILFFHSTDTSMTNVSAAYNEADGIFLLHSTNTKLMNVSAAHNADDGLVLFHSTDTSMMNVSAAHNALYGIYLGNSTNTSMKNVSAEHNGDDGIVLHYSTDTSMMNASAGYNEADGIVLVHSTKTSMMNVSSAHNVVNGIYLLHCTDTSMTNVSAAYNVLYGVYLSNSTNTDMTNVSAAHNEIDGIFLLHSTDTSVMNVFAAHNAYDGIYLNYSTNTNLMNVSAAHNDGEGIYLHNCTNTRMMNVSAAYNEVDGIFLLHSTDTNMMNVSAAHNAYDGIVSFLSTDTSMMNVSSAHNELNGIFFLHSIGTSMMNVSATHNVVNGIYLGNSTNTRMLNVSAAYNAIDGICLNYSTNTNLMNVSAANNKIDGIFLLHCTDTSMMNVSAAYNALYGIYLGNSTNTRMLDVSAAHNVVDGIYLNYSTNTKLVNVSAVDNDIDGIYLRYSTNTSMMNISAAYNQYNAIAISQCTNTSLYYSYTCTYPNRDGIYISGCTTTYIVNHNTGNKIYVENSADIHILNSVFSEHTAIEMTNTANTYITNTTSFITAYDTTNIVLNDILFSNMDAPSTASSTSEPASLPAVISLYSSTLMITDCTFTANNISSIKTVGSNVTMSGKVLFHNNTASSGTVLISVRNSLLITTDYSNIHFQNNHAIHYGGVFYITTEESYETSMSLQDIIQNDQGGGSLIISKTECFLHVKGSRSHARFTFINNTAGRGGDVLYGGLVALGYDGDWNCLLSFKNISDMSHQSGLSRISSAPSRVCLCNETGQPDCLTVADPTTRVIYPGQSITISAVVVGQDFGTVTGSLFPQISHTSDSVVYLEQKQDNIAIEHSQCSQLRYTIFSPNEESAAVLVFTHDNREIPLLMNEEDNQKMINTWAILSKEPNYKTLAQNIICDFIAFQTFQWPFTIKYNESNQSDNRTIEDFYKFTTAFVDKNNKNYCESEFIQTKFVFPKEIYSYPIYMNISFHPCPPGFSLSKNPPFRCDCNQLIKQLPRVKCHIQDQTISRSGLVWISIDGNETATASNCPYNYCNREEINITLEEINMTLEDPDSQCNFNHSGTLCGGCKPGLSLALGTNQCLHCPNTHLALLLPFALAGVVLVCFIKVIDLTISQGTLNGLIFYANVVKANEYLLYNEEQTNPLAVFIAWLNLDLGIETCFLNGLTAYGKTWLQFVFPLYIWSIAGLIIMLAKYSDGVAKVMGNNSVPVLATLFLLSYAKLFRTIITALSFTMLSTTYGSKAVWSADGNLDYLGPEHAPLFAVAAATLLFLWLPYTLLLFLGQWLHRCNCHIITHMMIKIKPFLDAHYGPLKGNHRYWFGALLLVRAVILLISALIPANRTNITVFSITVCALVLMTGFAVGVYKSFAVATFNAVWFLNLGLLSISHMLTTLEGGSISLASNCLFGLAFAQFIGLVFFKVLVICKRSERVMRCLHRGQPAEDDWELYEQAALQREMESDSEGEESEESGSIESLPTYGY